MGAYKRQSGRAEPEQTAGPLRARAMPGLLALQRLAGNRAVTAVVQRSVTTGKFNVVGEHHDESDPRRVIDEKRYAKEKFTLDYWDEKNFFHEEVRGDDYYLSAIQDVVYVHNLARTARDYATEATELATTDQERVQRRLKAIPHLLDKCAQFAMDLYNTKAKIAAEDQAFADACVPLPRLANSIKNDTGMLLHDAPDAIRRLNDLIDNAPKLMAAAEHAVRRVDGIAQFLDEDDDGREDPWHHLELVASVNRGQHMLQIANRAASAGTTGLWKVGDDHIDEMRYLIGGEDAPRDADVVLTDRREFNAEFGKWISEQRGT